MRPGDGDVPSFGLGQWEVYPTLNRIARGGKEYLLEPKVMDLLQVLAREAPRVVSRQDLMDEVWPGHFVTEHALSRCVSELRKALGDDAQSPRYLETIRKGGYRLLQTPRQAAAPSSPTPRPSPLSQEPPAGAGQPDRDIPPEAPWARRLGKDGRRSRLVAALALALLATMAALWIMRPWGTPQADEWHAAVPLTSHPGSEVDPALSPDGELLAYSWDGPDGDNFDIYLMAVGESSGVRLTRHPGEDKNPVFFPDGKSIAFVRSAPGQEGIYAVSWKPAAGQAPGGLEAVSETLLTRCNTGDIPDLAISPEGRYLYFSDLPAHGRPPSAIYRLDLEQGRREAVTRPPEYAFGDRDLALSHDGSRLAFARAEIAGIEELFVADLAAGAVRQLTFQNESIMGMTWTPDDREILFASSRALLNLLWSQPADGSALARPLSSLGGQLHDPHLNRRSSRLLFEYKEFQSNLWLAETTTAARGEVSLQLTQALSPSTRWDINPAVAGDGRMALISTRSGFPALWRRDPGGILLRLTDDSLLPGRPSWSPDGRSLVFTDRSRGQADLVRISPAGGTLSRLTDTAHNEVAPSFSHDGRAVYFGSDEGGQWQVVRWDIPPGEELRDGARPGGRLITAASGGAIRGLESKDGRFLYFARHSRPGLWRKLLPDGPETLVASGPSAGAWMDWALHGESLYYLEVGPNQSFLHCLDLSSQSESAPSPAGARRLRVPRSLYPGGGLALTPDGRAHYLTVLDRSESDILMARLP